MFKRLIFERIESRIMVGIVMFVATMILVGWVAINETARMSAFERQQLARSIERGAKLFSSNCSTCHNFDGRGQIERAPALNNPQLFGYNPFAEINGQIEPLERQLRDIQAEQSVLTEERNTLIAELGTNVSAERMTEITTRVGEIDSQLNATGDGSFQSRIDALNAELAPLREQRLTIVDSLDAAIGSGYLPGVESVAEEDLTNFLNAQTNRLTQFGFNGDLHGYVKTTLIHGRPGSAQVWPGSGGGMVAWSQDAGGPLREDQIEDITNYILNFDKGDGWTIEDVLSVNQYGKLHADAALAGEPVETIGTDVNAAVTAVAALTGDPVKGEALYTGAERTGARAKLGCATCHVGGAQAPNTEGTWDRVQTERLAALPGYTGEQYLVESILMPGNYIVPSYNGGIMPQTYGTQLTTQDLADIIAYLKTTGASQ